MGEALFKYEIVKNEYSFFLGGTAGFTLFFIVWFSFGKLFSASPTVPDSKPYHISIPDNWTFSSAATAIAKEDKAIVEMIGFTPEEMNARLESRELHCKDARELLTILGNLAQEVKIRTYKVIHKGATYTLRVC